MTPPVSGGSTVGVAVAVGVAVGVAVSVGVGVSVGVSVSVGVAVGVSVSSGVAVGVSSGLQSLSILLGDLVEPLVQVALQLAVDLARQLGDLFARIAQRFLRPAAVGIVRARRDVVDLLDQLVGAVLRDQIGIRAATAGQQQGGDERQPKGERSLHWGY